MSFTEVRAHTTRSGDVVVEPESWGLELFDFVDLEINISRSGGYPQCPCVFALGHTVTTQQTGLARTPTTLGQITSESGDVGANRIVSGHNDFDYIDFARETGDKHE